MFRFFRLGHENPFTGRHMLAVVIAFFGTIIAVNLTMAAFATGTFPGLVVQNAYVASQHYNEMLARARDQEAAGWTAELTGSNGILRLRLTGRDGRRPAGVTVMAVAGRPSTTREDRVLALVDAGDGHVAAEALPSGLWEVDVEVRRGDELVFRDTRRLFVDPAEGG